MLSGKSAPEDWSPPTKNHMSSMLNSIKPWHHWILEPLCNSRPAPWEMMRWLREGWQKWDSDWQGLLHERKLTRLWPLSPWRRQKNMTGVLGDKSGIEDWGENIVVQKLIFFQDKWVSFSYFSFFMCHIIKLRDLWLLQNGRKPKTYIDLKLTLQT